MTQAWAGLRLSALQLADANGQRPRQTLCAMWQALPREPDVPTGREGLPLERSLAPSSSPLLLLPPPGRRSVPGPGSTPGLPVSPLTAPEPGRSRANTGSPGPAGPQSCVVRRRPKALFLVPDTLQAGACRGATPGLALTAPPPDGESHAARPSPLGFVHVCAAPVCASRWAVAEDRPLESKTRCPAIGGQGQLGHFAQLPPSHCSSQSPGQSRDPGPLPGAAPGPFCPSSPGCCSPRRTAPFLACPPSRPNRVSLAG